MKIEPELWLAIPPTMTAIAARLAAAGAPTRRLLPALRAMSGRIEAAPARTQLQRENEAPRRSRYLVSGWAYRYTDLADGRRQIYDLILPGEGVGVCVQSRPISLTNVVALTPVELVGASELTRPDMLAEHPELARALNNIADDDEWRLLTQVTRLGRMSALERLCHRLVSFTTASPKSGSWSASASRFLSLRSSWATCWASARFT